MKIDKELIDIIENADAYYIIAVKGETHATKTSGKYTDDLQTIHHIVQGMLGSIDMAIKKKEVHNAWPLFVLITEAIKRFPKFILKQ